jgi:hypothetical protein
MKKSWSALRSGCLAIIGAAALCIVAGCASPCADGPFAKYNAAKEVQSFV